MTDTKTNIQCTGPECNRQAVSFKTGLCRAHRDQRGRGVALTPIRPRKDPVSTLLRDEEGQKWCAEGEHWAAVEKFAPYPRNLDGLQGSCTRCIGLSQHGLSQEIYKAAYDAQEGRCSITGEAHEVLHVDHDHHTGLARGLLSRRANTALGRMSEDIGLMLELGEAGEGGWGLSAAELLEAASYLLDDGDVRSNYILNGEVAA